MGCEEMKRLIKHLPEFARYKLLDFDLEKHLPKFARYKLLALKSLYCQLPKEKKANRR